MSRTSLKTLDAGLEQARGTQHAYMLYTMTAACGRVVLLTSMARFFSSGQDTLAICCGLSLAQR